MDYKFFPPDWSRCPLPEPDEDQFRPIAEPPILVDNHFLNKVVPSDIRMKLLFPNPIDYEKRITARDLVTEGDLLFEYLQWVKGHGIFDGHFFNNPDFYSGLVKAVRTDREQVNREHRTVHDSVSDLAKWEYYHLDQDGKCTRLLKQMESRYRDLKWCREAWEKYKDHAPEEYRPIFKEEAKERHNHPEASETASTVGRAQCPSQDMAHKDSETQKETQPQQPSETSINDPTRIPHPPIGTISPNTQVPQDEDIEMPDASHDGPAAHFLLLKHSFHDPISIRVVIWCRLEHRQHHLHLLYKPKAPPPAHHHPGENGDSGNTRNTVALHSIS